MIQFKSYITAVYIQSGHSARVTQTERSATETTMPIRLMMMMMVKELYRLEKRSTFSEALFSERGPLTAKKCAIGGDLATS